MTVGFFEECVVAHTYTMSIVWVTRVEYYKNGKENGIKISGFLYYQNKM